MYVALVGGMFAAFVINLVLDVLLVYEGLQGTLRSTPRSFSSPPFSAIMFIRGVIGS